MDNFLGSMSSMLKRARKPLIIAGVSFLLLGGLLLTGTGYLVYKTAGFAVAALNTQQSGQSSDVASADESAAHGVTSPKAGSSFVREFGSGVASAWLQRGLTEGNISQIRSGLACFDAVGGPSPAAVIALAKQHTADDNIRSQLASLKTQIADQKTLPSGPAACATWMLSG